MEVTLKRVETTDGDSGCNECIFFNIDEGTCDLTNANKELVESILPCEEYDENDVLSKTYVWKLKSATQI